jgi:hypothetical protein
MRSYSLCSAILQDDFDAKECDSMLLTSYKHPELNFSRCHKSTSSLIGYTSTHLSSLCWLVLVAVLPLIMRGPIYNIHYLLYINSVYYIH